jgi:regulation of enolase protein 1 (concanavalin A-like superfamily)
MNQLIAGQALSPNFRWLGEPKCWSIDPQASSLLIETAPQTDFWCRTHYGFVADNGHFLYREVAAPLDFRARVRAFPRHQYDQAGLLLRVDPNCWIKTSVEFEPDEPNRLGVVVTNQGYSDWSTQPIAKDLTTLWYRMQVRGADVVVEYSLDGETWHHLRTTHLLGVHTSTPLLCGIYACSPQNAGFRAEFTCFQLEEVPTA